ncbi:MAG: L,D-transpeptidase [Opitutales bacterium]
MSWDLDKAKARMKQHCGALSITPTKLYLVVAVATQELIVLENGREILRYPASTSRRPCSCKQDSLGTPTGLHAIADRIGAGAPLGRAFKGRVDTGRHFNEFPEDEQAGNLITTRILRLRGLEPGRNAGANCDSYARYIYIHGTNHESRIGEPFSGGCVELRNKDVAELFDRVHEGDLVWIEEP